MNAPAPNEDYLTRSAFVAIVGRPNVGKSTILNGLLGQKVSIVSSKPQTTRRRIKGVLTEGDTQIIFVDTPGMHRPRTKLGDFMVDEIERAIPDTDAAVLVVEPPKDPGDIEIGLIERIKAAGYPAILAVNKVDRAEKGALAATIAAYAELYDFAAVVPLSALTGDGMEILKAEILALAEPGPWYYEEDTVTDITERELAADIVREKALEHLDQEVPHGIAVEIERFAASPKGVLEIAAVITCEKDSQKGIIIGKGGRMLKAISTAARLEMENVFETRVFLEVFVRVRENWRDSGGMLRTFGFREDD